jgi:metal-sulfur cluster biosynthetic enzyme
VPGVEDVEVNLVWDPPWTIHRMSEAARLGLGLLSPGPTSGRGGQSSLTPP